MHSSNKKKNLFILNLLMHDIYRGPFLVFVFVPSIYFLYPHLKHKQIRTLFLKVIVSSRVVPIFLDYFLYISFVSFAPILM